MQLFNYKLLIILFSVFFPVLPMKRQEQFSPQAPAKFQKLEEMQINVKTETPDGLIEKLSLPLSIFEVVKDSVYRNASMIYDFDAPEEANHKYLQQSRISYEFFKKLQSAVALYATSLDQLPEVLAHKKPYELLEMLELLADGPVKELVLQEIAQPRVIKSLFFFNKDWLENLTKVKINKHDNSLIDLLTKAIVDFASKNSWLTIKKGKTFTISQGLVEFTLSSDGKRIAIDDFENHSIQILDTGSNTSIQVPLPNEEETTIATGSRAFNNNGTLLAIVDVCSSNNQNDDHINYQLIDVISGRIVLNKKINYQFKSILNLGCNTSNLIISNNLTYCVVVVASPDLNGRINKPIKLLHIDCVSNKITLVAEYANTDCINFSAISPNSRYLGLATDSFIDILDTKGNLIFKQKIDENKSVDNFIFKSEHEIVFSATEKKPDRVTYYFYNLNIETRTLKELNTKVHTIDPERLLEPLCPINILNRSFYCETTGYMHNQNMHILFHVFDIKSGKGNRAFSVKNQPHSVQNSLKYANDTLVISHDFGKLTVIQEAGIEYLSHESALLMLYIYSNKEHCPLNLTYPTCIAFANANKIPFESFQTPVDLASAYKSLPTALQALLSNKGIAYI